MTMHRKFLIAAMILIASALVPVTTSEAQRITVAIGDRPYYTRGPYYWHDNVRYVWVPGHYSRRGVWIRGRYVARERRGPVDRFHRRHRLHRRVLFGR